MPTLCRVFVGVLLISCSPALAATDTPPQLRDGWDTASPESIGLDPAPLAKLPDAIAHGDFPKTTSVLIVRGGKLVYERYFGDGNRDLLNNTRSATKSVTALALGVAIAERLIPSEHALAFSYLAELKPFQNDTPEKEAITIQDLLTMSSALDCNDDDDKSPGNEDNMHPQPNWARWAVDLPTMAGYVRDASGFGPWRYCTTGAFLAGQIVQRAVHTPIDRYIDSKLLQPLGIEKWEWPYSPAGETMTGGGLGLRSRDLAKLAWLLVNRGKWKDQEVVPAAWIDAALTVRRDAYAGLNYGYFFWHRNYASACGPVDGWFMSGNGGNAIVSLRSLDAAIVVTRMNYNTHGMHQQTIDLIEKYLLPAFPCAPPR
jgi:CubicO group peptidase (beta-lactamase class C family)